MGLKVRCVECHSIDYNPIKESEQVLNCVMHEYNIYFVVSVLPFLCSRLAPFQRNYLEKYKQQLAADQRMCLFFAVSGSRTPQLQFGFCCLFIQQVKLLGCKHSSF